MDLLAFDVLATDSISTLNRTKFVEGSLAIQSRVRKFIVALELLE
jgi:hypothetical protein